MGKIEWRNPRKHPSTGTIAVDIEITYDDGTKETSEMTLWPEATEEEIDYYAIQRYRELSRKRAENSTGIDVKTNKSKTITV